jgi:hypothetical protein
VRVPLATATFVEFLLQHLVDFILFFNGRTAMIALRPAARRRVSLGLKFFFGLVFVTRTARDGRARRFGSLIPRTAAATTTTRPPATFIGFALILGRRPTGEFFLELRFFVANGLLAQILVVNKRIASSGLVPFKFIKFVAPWGPGSVSRFLGPMASPPPTPTTAARFIAFLVTSRGAIEAQPLVFANWFISDFCRRSKIISLRRFRYRFRMRLGWPVFPQPLTETAARRWFSGTGRTTFRFVTAHFTARIAGTALTVTTAFFASWAAVDAISIATFAPSAIATVSTSTFTAVATT